MQKQNTLPLALRAGAKQVLALHDLDIGNQYLASRIANRSVLCKLAVLQWITWHQMDGVTGTMRCAYNRDSAAAAAGHTTGRVMPRNQSPVPKIGRISEEVR